MEDYYKWQIEQLRATISKQDKIIQDYARRELARMQDKNNNIEKK